MKNPVAATTVGKKPNWLRPATLDADTALAMLRAEPLLIRRPLIEVDGQRMTGFDASTLSVWLGQPILVNTASQTCLRHHPSQR